MLESDQVTTKSNKKETKEKEKEKDKEKAEEKEEEEMNQLSDMRWSLRQVQTAWNNSTRNTEQHESKGKGKVGQGKGLL